MLAIRQILLQEWICNTSKIRTTTYTGNHHVRIFTRLIHLFEGFLTNHRLMQQYVI
jgi:hypothetical protein